MATLDQLYKDYKENCISNFKERFFPDPPPINHNSQPAPKPDLDKKKKKKRRRVYIPSPKIESIEKYLPTVGKKRKRTDEEEEKFNE